MHPRGEQHAHVDVEEESEDVGANCSLCIGRGIEDLGELLDEEENEEIAGKGLRFDVVDGEVVLVGIFLFLAVLRDGNEGGVEVSGITNAAEEERVGRMIPSGEFRGVELRLCRVVAEIVVLNSFGAPVITVVSYPIRIPLLPKGVVVLTASADTWAFPASSPKSPPRASAHDKTQRRPPPSPAAPHPS